MAPQKKTLMVVGGVAIIAIAASGSLLYLKSGTGRDVAAVAPPPEIAPAGTMTGRSSLTIEQAADRLSRRLALQDGSADDWALLARSYVELRQYPAAVRAFEKALKKAPGDAQLAKDLAAARRAAGS